MDNIEDNKDKIPCCFCSPDPTKSINYYECLNAFEEEDDKIIVTSNCVPSDLSNGDTERNTHFYDSVPISEESDNTQYVPTVNTKLLRSEFHKTLKNYVIRNSADLGLREIEKSGVRNNQENLVSKTTPENRIERNMVQNQLENENGRKEIKRSEVRN